MKSYNMMVKEAAVQYGLEEASISELLALVIGKNAQPDVCQEIAGIPTQRLLEMSEADFLSYEGIGKVAAERLRAMLQLTRKLGSRSLDRKTIVRSQEDAAEIFRYLNQYSQEHFTVAYLSAKQGVIAREEVFVGDLNSCIVHPREVYKKAITHSAAHVICAHNHPSGDATPSREDIEMTRRLIEVGKMIGIELLDHIIIGDGEKYTSMKELGYL
ncbi:DNA repair protein RadC [Pontibacillus sp. ALD_SL1]|uniref:RadC family protein n=1 Tax=Pontibacillus sp. ALD_SL1 TaxID=2777185 RepID=UPI001F6169C0|nr:DNA repair protein RadC [Pontibacillus sp. ALD_SL1]